MSVVLILLFAIFVVLISFLQVRSHKQKIREKVHSIGGEVISIKREFFFKGPFLVVRRGRTMYKFQYSKDNIIKIGWVLFGDLSGPHWKL